MDEEVWVEIEEFPNYLVSDYGRVWSNKTKRLLKQSFNGRGYLHIRICDENGRWKISQRTSFRVRRLGGICAV